MVLSATNRVQSAISTVTVTFSEPVLHFDATDITISGMPQLYVANVTFVNASNYVITITGANVDGFFTVAFDPDTDVTDLATNALIATATLYREMGKPISHSNFSSYFQLTSFIPVPTDATIPNITLYSDQSYRTSNNHNSLMFNFSEAITGWTEDCLVFDDPDYTEGTLTIIATSAFGINATITSQGFSGVYSILLNVTCFGDRVGNIPNPVIGNVTWQFIRPIAILPPTNEFPIKVNFLQITPESFGLEWSRSAALDIDSYLVQLQPEGTTGWTTVGAGAIKSTISYPFFAPGKIYNIRLLGVNSRGIQVTTNFPIVSMLPAPLIAPVSPPSVSDILFNHISFLLN